MKTPLTLQLVGELIENGYTYVLANVGLSPDEANNLPVVLKPVKYKPHTESLPDGYTTFYKITREPLQFACGVEGTTVEVEHDSTFEDIKSSSLFDDSYFRMSEDFFHQVLESIEDYAVFTTNTVGNVNSWNSGAENVLGYTQQEILGINSAIFFTEEDRQKQAPQIELETAKAQGRSIDERFHVRKDGSRFWGSGLVFPLYDEDHKHRGFTKIMRNLEERKEAEQEGAPK